MRSFILILLISIFFVNVAQAASKNDCLRTSFMDRDISAFTLGTVKGGVSEEFIYKQSSACPFDAECKKRFSLKPLEDVIVSHTKEDWSCSWYRQVLKSGKVRKRIGWIKSESIILSDSPGSIDQRKGSWVKIFGSGAFSVDEYGDGYLFRGKATYRKKGKKIITEIMGRGSVKGRYLKFQANNIESCNLRFMPLGLDYAIINEVENCGVELGFSGVYKRTEDVVSYDNYLLPMDIYNKLDITSFNNSLSQSFTLKKDVYLKDFFRIKDKSPTMLVLEGRDRYWIIELLSNNRIRLHDKIISGTYDSVDVYETITSGSRIIVKN